MPVFDAPGSGVAGPSRFATLFEPSGAAPTGTALATLRAAVRPLLRAVIRRAGTLYQPLYLGPVPGPEVFEADIQAFAETEGLPVHMPLPRETRRVPAPSAPGVLVLGVDAALQLLADRATIPALSQQVIIWGAAQASDLPEALRAWVARGLAFAPAEHARPSGHEWSMGPTLARCAQRPGALYNPVFLIGPVSSLPLVADEAMLRLEAGGLHPVLTFGAVADFTVAATARVDPHGAVVVRLSSAVPTGSDAEPFHEAVEALMARRVQLVLVGDARLQEATAQDPRWQALAQRGITLVVAAERSRARDRLADRAARLDRATAWPGPAEILVGAPACGPEPERLMAGRAAVGGTRTLALSDMLQMVAMGQTTGRLVVFTATRLGTIDFHQGRIIHADVLGDRWSVAALAAARGLGPDAAPDQRRALCASLVTERVCRLATWTNTQWVLSVGPHLTPPPEELVSMQVGGLALEMARRLDEAPLRAARIGGLERIWRRADGATAPEGDGAAERLWRTIDGATPLGEVAHALGLLDEEALDAVAQLVAEGRLQVVGAGPAVTDDVAAARVATTLLAWGLSSEAAAALAAAEQEQAFDADAAFLTGHLLAPVDPHGAVAHFRRALQGYRDAPAASSRTADATLNIALLEVRGRQTEPAAAWAAVQPALVVLRTAGRTTSRHLALIGELALRAGYDAVVREICQRLVIRTTDAESQALGHVLTQALTVCNGP